MGEYLGLVRAAIREGQAQGIFPSQASREGRCQLLFGAVDEMVTSWALAETNYELSDIADSVADIILLRVET
jgi:hypothetical protein